MAPCEALYGRRCRSSVGRFEPVGDRLLGTDLVQDAFDKVKMILERLHMAQSRQKVHDVAYMVGEKYVGDPSHVLDFSTVQLDGNLTYDVEPVAILGRQVRKLRSKDITSVKVKWKGSYEERRRAMTQQLEKSDLQ
ncbi:uncharacterized protein [Nicotiana tomentosiformis]|uniref:uncharacterized protein n=1 Tax=Nicotiana tomentosiformis TaxID=4098 RepID=UPI00388C9035